MSPHLSCALAASAALLAAAPLHATPLQYVYEGEVALVDADLTGTVWDGVSVSDAFLYTVTIDPGAAVTDSPNVNNKLYGLAILDFAVTIGSISDSGIPDPPEHSFSGLRVVHNQPNNVIASFVDTPTYDINGHIQLDPATLSSADIPTTPGTHVPFAPVQSFVALDDGFGGFINISLNSFTIVPTPNAAAPFLALAAVTTRRRRPWKPFAKRRVVDA